MSQHIVLHGVARPALTFPRNTTRAVTSGELRNTKHGVVAAHVRSLACAMMVRPHGVIRHVD